MRLIFPFLLLLIMILPLSAQSEIEYPTITSDDASDLAIIARIDKDTLGILQHEFSNSSYRFQSDSQRLAIGTRSEIYLFNQLTNEVETTLSSEAINWRPENIVFSSDNRFLAASDYYGGLKVWEIDTQTIILEAPASGVMSFSVDNRFLFVYGLSVIHVFELEEAHEIDRRIFCNNLVTIRDSVAVCSENGTFEFIDLNTFELVGSVSVTLEGENGRFESQTEALSPDNQYYVFFYSINNIQRYLMRLNLETQAYEEPILINYEPLPHNYRISPDSNLFLVGAESENQLIDGMTGDILFSFSPQRSYQVMGEFSPDGKFLIMRTETYSTLTIYAVSACYITSSRTLNLRSGAGTAFDSPMIMQTSDRFAVVGRSIVAQETWWELDLGLWVRADLVEVHGDGCDLLTRD